MRSSVAPRICSATLVCACLLLTAPPTFASGATWYPPGYPHATGGNIYPQQNQTITLRSATTQVAHTHSKTTTSNELNPLVQGVRFFQKFISPVDGPRCPMYPTCSTYALQALQRHGPVLGSFLSVDRLLHETTPAEQTIPLQGFERLRYYDPLDANDFWLNPAKSHEQL